MAVEGAMIRNLKRVLKQRFPSWYERAYGLKLRAARQVRTEYKVLRELVRRALGPKRPFRSWKELLPMQTATRVSWEDFGLPSADAFLEDLEARGLEHSRHGDGAYLPPETFRRSPLGPVAAAYPRSAALQLDGEGGGPADAGGASGPPSRGDPHPGRWSLLAANILYRESLGPRVYDTLEIRGRTGDRTAYVVEHAGGPAAAGSGHPGPPGRLAELLEDRILASCPRGWTRTGDGSTGDGPPPVPGATGGPAPLDYRAFQIGRYDRYLKRIALAAASDTHFGETSILRRGRFLYQSVPGVRLPAKRSCDARMDALDRMMASSGRSIAGRLVLDVGCNLGIMMAEYLKRGARWCHGWDAAAVVPHTESILLALGCTRFSATGAHIETARRMEDDVPEFVAPLLDGCVISYLAIRLHVGWLEALGCIPWSFMIYEGHQYETAHDFERFLAQLREMVPCDPDATAEYTDGFSDRRVVALIARRA